MRCENGQARWCASSAPGFLKDLILRHLTHPLFLARFDLNAGNRLATADPSCHFLLALRHELAPFIVIAGEAFGRDRHCKCDMALRLAQLGVFRVLDIRSDEHTSELQSLMRTSYAVFCLKKQK